jgi:VWFA-related protein
MRLRCISVAVLLACARFAAQEQPTFTIRVNSDLVQVRVIVRDRDGRFVPDLAKDDFTLKEDGRVQQLSAVDRETVGVTNEMPTHRLPLQLPILSSSAPLPAAAARGLRLVVLFFDFTSLDLADGARALRAAEDYIGTIGGADCVAIVTLAPKLEVQQDFTADKAQLLQTLRRLHGLNQMVLETADDPSYELFYRYGRLEYLRVLTTTLARVAQKKSVVIFAGKIPSDDLDLVGITNTVDGAVRAGVSFYGLDATGLNATPPLGDASVAASYGMDVLSGKAVVQDRAIQGDQLLYALAHGTGGRAFFDSNDFGRPFRSLENDTSEYYILSYRSSNSQRDGRYRHISLNVRRPRVELKYQAGYYAPRAETPVSTRDVERILSEQLAANLPATSLPVFGFVDHLHIGKDLFYIPITVVLPSEAVLHNGAASSALIGLAITDHRGHLVRKLRDVISPVVATQHQTRAVQYQTATQLPAGEYTVRIVAVQNRTGQVGSFSTPLRVLQQDESPLHVSSLLSGSLVACSDSSKSPLDLHGLCLEINPLREYAARQDFAMQFQVECGARNARTPCDPKQTRSSLQCFFSDQRAFNVEPPATAITEHTAVFRVGVPAGTFHPGIYQCRVTGINPQLGAFAFGATQIRVWDELRNPLSASGSSGP